MEEKEVSPAKLCSHFALCQPSQCQELDFPRITVPVMEEPKPLAPTSLKQVYTKYFCTMSTNMYSELSSHFSHSPPQNFVYSYCDYTLTIITTHFNWKILRAQPSCNLKSWEMLLAELQPHTANSRWMGEECRAARSQSAQPAQLRSRARSSGGTFSWCSQPAQS